MAVELRPVTEQNWKSLIKLKVSESQTHFVASNLYSIAEAQFGFEEQGRWDLFPLGAYVEDKPVGFVMFAYNFGHSRFQAFIVRLMVDQQFQGKGYGRQIMQLVLKDFRANPKIRNVGISYEPENDVARRLYASLGFVEPGEMLDGETLAVLYLH